LVVVLLHFGFGAVEPGLLFDGQLSSSFDERPIQNCASGVVRLHALEFKSLIRSSIVAMSWAFRVAPGASGRAGEKNGGACQVRRPAAQRAIVR
jgi:hypothetical protein